MVGGQEHGGLCCGRLRVPSFGIGSSEQASASTVKGQQVNRAMNTYLRRDMKTRRHRQIANKEYHLFSEYGEEQTKVIELLAPGGISCRSAHA